jgi:papain like protease
MKVDAGGAARVINVESSPARVDDWPPSRKRRLKDTKPPRSLDLRKGRTWYRVHDQEETGSCVGWALADSVMRWQLVEAGRLKPNQWLSARFIWMASKELRAQRLLLEDWRPSTFLEEAPTSAKDALDVARYYGAVTNRTLVWDGPLNRGPVDEFFDRAAEFRIASYHSLDRGGPAARRLQWQQWLHQYGPVLLVVTVDQSFLKPSDGKVEAFEPRQSPFLHACALVGYEGDRFIVRNSWGKRWGDGGYALVSPEWLEQGAEETYGVVF